MDFYRTIYKEGTGEIVEKKSRFIAEAYPVTGEEEAFAHLEEVKKRYWDARHHCWAYVTGRNPGKERMSDDGEPAGTAGKPILEVIRGRELTDIFIVVTRYFGGVKLGTGGLVRAYTSSAKMALDAAGICDVYESMLLTFEFEYSFLARITAMEGDVFSIEDVRYTDVVEADLSCTPEEKNRLTEMIANITGGRGKLKEEKITTIKKRI